METNNLITMQQELNHNNLNSLKHYLDQENYDHISKVRKELNHQNINTLNNYLSK